MTLKSNAEIFASGQLDLPRWSSDQRFLLVGFLPNTGRNLRADGYERWGIYAVDTATLNPCRLTPLAQYDNRDPVWVAAP